MRRMNSTELFLLGRQLIKLAEEGLQDQGGRSNARFVLIDVWNHPQFDQRDHRSDRDPQSHVSVLVTRLRDRGVLRTEVDNHDRRRTLVYPVPEAVRRARHRVGSTVEGPIARSMGTTETVNVAEVVDAFQLVASRLGGSFAEGEVAS